MGRNLSLGISRLEILLPFIVLLFLLPYTYAHFLVRPFLGINVHPVSGYIRDIINQSTSGDILNVGDRVIQVDNIDWNEFTQNVYNPGQRIEPGRELLFTIQRGDGIFNIKWIVPAATQRELLTRFTDTWWLGYIFWIAGTLVILFIRPKHSRRMLLAAFLYLGAIWLTTGLVSAWGNHGIWRSSTILHLSFWLLVPISIHFHWTFPSQIARPPKFWWLIYLVGISLAIAEWFNLLPQTAYLFGGLIAAIGSIVLLLLHAILQPKHRQDVIPLVILIGFALLPVIVMGVATIINPRITTNTLSLITLIAIPGAYLFAVYRHQIGDMELRHNRIVTVFIFLALLCFIFITIGVFVESRFQHVNSAYVVTLAILSAVLSSILTLLFYSPIQRIVERYIIGIPYDISYLTESYSARITTSLDTNSLIHILTDEILPSLLIRQSALYRFKGTNDIQKLFSIGVAENYLPNSDMIKRFLEESSEIHKHTNKNMEIRPERWVRLALPLKLENSYIGVWLLGRHDPDDYYSKSEVKSLQSIADQTAIALTNIEQAEYLYKLNQMNIDRHEAERQKLALELHDQVLSQLAIMIMNPNTEPHAEISDICTDIAASIRKMVDGLRPAMLNYGLCHAIEELCDNIYELSDNGLTINIELPFTGIRYQPQAELHIYRIIQQACNNILQHARAHRISISGSMDPDVVDIYVQDDGVGFHIDKKLDLPDLLSKRNYGIVGMYERASLIGAELDISSSPDQGTTVHVNWKPDATRSTTREAEKIATVNAN